MHPEFPVLEASAEEQVSHKIYFERFKLCHSANISPLHRITAAQAAKSGQPHETGMTPMKRMIKEMPEAALIVLNNCYNDNGARALLQFNKTCTYAHYNFCFIF